MAPNLDTFLIRWHRLLNLPRQTTSTWHRTRLREELLERHHAKSPLARTSEASDVLFAISRAAFDGFPICTRPRGSVAAYTYMLAKYTSRWAFYRTAARFAGVSDFNAVSEVVNPAKDAKLDAVAARHGINPVTFRTVGRRLRWVWPLLP